MEDRDLLQANASMIAGTLLFSPFKENLIESNLLSCIINKRIVIALPIAAGISVLAYIFSFQVGAFAAFPAIVAIAILGYAVSKPAWLIVERVTTSDYGNTPLLAISNADREYYASLVEALRKAEEVFMAHSETKNLRSLSRIYRNEAYKILDFLRSQNHDLSSKRFYVEYDGRAYHAMLQFQYERPRLVD
jgi:hypothetical protein